MYNKTDDQIQVLNNSIGLWDKQSHKIMTQVQADHSQFKIQGSLLLPGHDDEKKKVSMVDRERSRYRSLVKKKDEKEKASMAMTAIVDRLRSPYRSPLNKKKVNKKKKKK
jgi:hypothetical protein